MPRLTIAALLIAGDALVFAVWPVLADAPWEDEPPDFRGLRCEAALSMRERATFQEAANQAQFDYLNEVLDEANREVAEFC